MQAAGEHLQQAMGSAPGAGGAGHDTCSSLSAGAPASCAAYNSGKNELVHSRGNSSGGAGARTYVVWGSSCGWMVLFGAAVFGWRCRGVELLRCLHEVARGCLAEAERQGASRGREG